MVAALVLGDREETGDQRNTDSRRERSCRRERIPFVQTGMGLFQGDGRQRRQERTRCRQQGELLKENGAVGVVRKGLSEEGSVRVCRNGDSGRLLLSARKGLSVTLKSFVNDYHFLVLTGKGAS